MSHLKSLIKYIKMIDLFSVKFEFNINKKSSNYKSTLGGCTTISLIIFTILVIIYNIMIMLNFINRSKCCLKLLKNGV